MIPNVLINVDIHEIVADLELDVDDNENEISAEDYHTRCMLMMDAFNAAAAEVAWEIGETMWLTWTTDGRPSVSYLAEHHADNILDAIYGSLDLPLELWEAQ